MVKRLRKISSGSTTQDGYDSSFYEHLFKIEDRHFWFKSRNQVISCLVEKIVAIYSAGYKVLELGCGTGNVLRILEQVCKNGKVLGMDLFAEGLKYARQRTSCLLVQGDLSRPPFNKLFDLIGLFDVLEHFESDVSILCSLYDLLPKGGALILTVPAHPSLWSYFDESSHHRRRYTLKELKNKLRQAGYRIEYITAYMAPIFPIVWMKRKLRKPIYRNYVHRKNDMNLYYEWAKRELRIIPVINNFLSLMLSLETHLINRRLYLPFGTSLIAIARKDK